MADMNMNAGAGSDVPMSADLALAESADAALAQVNSLGNAREIGIWSSVPAESFEDKLTTLNAVSGAQPLDSLTNTGTVIGITHVIAQAVEYMADGGNGAKRREHGVRTVLLCEDGSSYAAMSDGIRSSVKNMIGILGHPSGWDKPVFVTVTEQQGRNGYKFMTLTPASAPAPKGSKG